MRLQQRMAGTCRYGSKENTSALTFTGISGVPFSFTAEITDDKTESLVSEIVSFVDAIEPEICAEEWMIKSGGLAASRYLQAVADMEGIRTEAWLLACELSEAISGKPVWAILPKNGIN